MTAGSERKSRRLAAIIWDFDGTLVDSREKNRQVTRQILRRVTGRNPDAFPAVCSLAAYDAATQGAANWRVLYRDVLGLSEDQTAHAGLLWSGFQLRNDAPTPFYDGLRDVLWELRHLPHAIVSQNSRAQIRRALTLSELDGFFHSVVGYEEVANGRQKPAPDGLVMCVEQLDVSEPACLLFVGDHEGDMECARRGSRELKAQGMDIAFVGVAAMWGGHADPSKWLFPPAFRADRVDSVVEIVRRLGS